MEIVEGGVVASLIVVVYALVDKVIVPLMKAKKNVSLPDKPSLSSDAQRIINDDHTRRLDDIDGELSRIRDGFEDVRASVATIGTHGEVSKAILERIESRLEKMT